MYISKNSLCNMATKHRQALSPHLGIYKPQISSILSIMHRASGVFNFFGMICFVWWIVSIAYTHTPYAESFVWNFFMSYFGMAILMAWSFSLFFHVCTGIRHLFWDMGYGFGVKTMNITGYLAIITALILTSICWYIVYMQLLGGK
jgi:succinate dehydrogenase / fumarate reductase cytochrome b subunit